MSNLGTSRFARSLGLLAACCLSAAPVHAQLPPYPTASATAAEAVAGFDQRAEAAIALNACGREPEYAVILGELRASNFEHQGEGMTDILVAKATYVRKHGDAPCTATLPRADLPATRCFDIPNNDGASPVVTISVGRACMATQVNDAVMAMRKHGVLGSSDLVCISNFDFKSEGELDVSVREWVRLLYIAGTDEPRLLTQPTIDHMYNELLATRGGPSDDSYSTLTGCDEPAHDELGSPEELADRHAWYAELGSSITDFLGWLASLIFRTATLAVATAPSLVAAPFLAIAGIDSTPLAFPGLTGLDVRIPETENHRLMIESSRFLVNADIIARLKAKNYGGTDGIADDQAKVRDWLLQRLQDITINDFREYNARPYTRYSLNAVLNLHDFAAVHGDEALKTAAWIVLDLSEAKFAATSNRGRRTSPFRRRAEMDGYGDIKQPLDLYNVVYGGDHEVARAMLLANQTQLLKNAVASRDGLLNVVNAATSSYRLPPPVAAAAVDRREFTQSFRHAGVERVFQSPAFTITAGGVRVEPTANVMGLSDDNDRGVAMPTTIMPTIAGTTLGDLFLFDGVGVGADRADNTCVARGFACGIQPRMSAAFSGCKDPVGDESDQVVIVSSQLCMPKVQPAFFLAARSVACTGGYCAQGRHWGVMDIVEAPSADPAVLARFKSERVAALRAITPDRNGRATYRSAAGQAVDFSLNETGPTVMGLDGAPPPGFATAGDLVDADGKGRATIKGPGGPITIDFTDRNNPVRRAPVPPPLPPLPGGGVK